MSNSCSDIMPWRLVILHVVIVCALSCVAIYFISGDLCPSISDYISGVGSVASIYAILITLWQFVKKTDEIKEAVAAKTKEISSFLIFAEIEKKKEVCNTIYSCINGEQYEAAAMKLDDIRNLLIEMRDRSSDTSEIRKINKLISDIGNDSVNLRNSWMSKEKIEIKIIFDHINRVSNVLSDISSNLKSEKL